MRLNLRWPFPCNNGPAPEELENRYARFRLYLRTEFCARKNNVARAPGARPLQSGFTQNYQQDFLRKRHDDPQMREHYANLLLTAVKRELENGSLDLVDHFIKSSQNGKGPIEFAKEIAGLLLFAKSQQTSGLSEESLTERIELLNSF